jgi:recombination DNA repair RAD52 pathway protein
MKTFSPDQINQLSAPLSREVVKTREQGGRNVSYVESWHVIAECNRIFGFDGWLSETNRLRCVSEKERMIGVTKTFSGYPGWGVTYVARCRIIVLDGLVFRDGVGAGHGIDRDLGQAHESAIKEAESDARKRALMSFGNQFGLALYDKTQSNVADESDLSRQRFIEECKASIERIGAHPDPKDLLNWWNSEVEKKKRRDFDLSPAEVMLLKGLVTAKVKP